MASQYESFDLGPGEFFKLGCVSCDQKGCAACDERGFYHILGGDELHNSLPTSVWDAFQSWTFVKHGILPNAGGLLDQPQSLINAFTFIQAEDARWRSRKKIWSFGG